ncbi:hypothetical protein GCM10010140_30010 [Streptosporangium pseudovulgare]|uniref:Centromere-binding protein ParB C-terminal domain-containing protein n=1 Tax=Streptosporangium pseudovulgare TaxID=35765 RepID=A0ABQ2QWK3_9ACTN|nr:hypothetical protein GCM10010140_30010 [Streptosporangium pseudovulgare]
MDQPEAARPRPVIPGWRIIRSDAGRFRASRERPFAEGSRWDGPPYRTVDADTFEELRAEVIRQEEAARGPGPQDATGEAARSSGPRTGAPSRRHGDQHSGTPHLFQDGVTAP